MRRGYFLERSQEVSFDPYQIPENLADRERRFEEMQKQSLEISQKSRKSIEGTLV